MQYLAGSIRWWVGGMVALLLAMAALAADSPAPVASPALRYVQQLDAKSVQIVWTYPAAAEVQIKGFQILRAAGTEKEFKPSGPLLPAKIRESVEHDAKKSGVEYRYKVAAIPSAAGATPIESEMEGLYYYDKPLPPLPRNLRLTWQRENGKAFIKMTWDAKAAGDKLTESFRLFSDSAREGKILREASVTGVKANEYRFETPNLSDRTYSLGVAGIAANKSEGPFIEATCFAPGSEMPKPDKLESARDAKGYTISWTYGQVSHLSGFEVIQNNKKVAGPDTLGPKSRSWNLPVPAGSKDLFTIQVIAISSAGLRSSAGRIVLSANETGQAGGTDARPATPANFRSEWIERDGKKQILLRWDAPRAPKPARYRLKVDDSAFGSLGNAFDIKLDKENEYVYVPPKADRSYTFLLFAMDRAGGYDSHARAVQLAPGRLLPPPVPNSIEELTHDAAANQLEIKWTCAPSEKLKGFRFYIDDKLVADETELGKDARSWKTKVAVSTKPRHRCDMEAVAVDGTTSERSPARTYGFNP